MATHFQSYVENSAGYKLYAAGDVIAVVDPTNPIEHEVNTFDTLEEACTYIENKIADEDEGVESIW